MIFNKNLHVDLLNKLGKGNMGEHLGIRFTEIGEDYITATMPVDHRTKQPLGLLHGGANLVLAETLGSVAATCCIDTDKQYCVGLEINANHIKSVRSGLVEGIAKPLHIGGKTQIWEIKIFSETKELTCVSRITIAVLDKKQR
ncbi:hotdog fold thioesterase [Echinicola sp. CAU 1574]|uniref:Hotdog fold thioesterase n=1 Tax=Echinicola arenosa TaxID=2774144 RepID=A0ABR9AH35_9BACT|nr:hotdog fold thioesterase [Echinicola arenosa]MBD8487596.1 hotdog fold thioesterase [Echinicola arenosa]